MPATNSWCSECSKSIDKFMDCNGHKVCTDCYGKRLPNYWAEKYAYELKSVSTPCRNCLSEIWIPIGPNIYRCQRCGHFGTTSANATSNAPSRMPEKGAPPNGKVRWNCVTCGERLEVPVAMATSSGRCHFCKTVQVPQLPAPEIVGNRAMAVLLAAISSGVAMNIGWPCSGKEEWFNNILLVEETYVARPEFKFPQLTIVLLKKKSWFASRKRIVVRTGPYAQYDAYCNNYPPPSELLKHLPESIVNNRTAEGVSNVALPGCAIVSTAEFDKLRAEIKSGKYAVEKAFAIEGLHPLCS